MVLILYLFIQFFSLSLCAFGCATVIVTYGVFTHLALGTLIEYSYMLLWNIKMKIWYTIILYLSRSMNSAVVAAFTHCSRCFVVGHNSTSGTSTTDSGRVTASCCTLSTSTDDDKFSKSTEVTVTYAMQG